MKVNWVVGCCVGILVVVLAGCGEEKATKPGAGAKSDAGKGTPAVSTPDAGRDEEEPILRQGDERHGGRPVDPVGGEEAGVDEVGTAVRWTDEVGNAIRFRDNPELVNPDLVAVDALSKEGNLLVVYRFAPGSLAARMAQKMGDPPMHSGASISELYLDLDDDASTGARVGEGEDEQGYELKVSVMTGFGFVDPESGEENAMFGDVGIPERMTELQADASRTTWILDPAAEERGTWGTMESGTQDAESRRLTVLGKDMVVVYVPYAWFGLESGDVVRVAFTDEKGEDDSMSEAQRVMLK